MATIHSEVNITGSELLKVLIGFTITVLYVAKPREDTMVFSMLKNMVCVNVALSENNSHQNK
jgi:hypothetical protein